MALTRTNPHWTWFVPVLAWLVIALRNARADRLQTSLNLALGSALASIGLTIPVVAAVSIVFGHPIHLGLQPKEIVLLALTLIVGVITWVPAAPRCCRA